MAATSIPIADVDEMKGVLEEFVRDRHQEFLVVSRVQAAGVGTDEKDGEILVLDSR